MKELSIEQKAKAYDEAIERAYSLLSGNQLGNAWIYKLFPELKESEDKTEPNFKDGDWLVSPNGVYWHIDAIRDGRYQVSSNSGECTDWSLDTNIYHKFTIQDAKDGDVLATGNKNIFIFKSISGYTIYDYCGLYFGKFEEDPATVNGTFAVQLPIDYVPATKEQRDLLFQKMREAGYQWDEEKKELKKIEQNPTDEEMKELLHTEYEKGRADATAEMQKPVEWSEEDEKIYNVVHDLAWESYKTSRRLDIPTFGIINGWLKSLKERCTWRPSDEQIAALTDAVNYWNKSGCYSSDLVQLLTDLKKLKGK